LDRIKALYGTRPSVVWHFLTQQINFGQKQQRRFAGNIKGPHNRSNSPKLTS